jgi:hypothetical protein
MAVLKRIEALLDCTEESPEEEELAGLAAVAEAGWTP